MEKEHVMGLLETGEIKPDDSHFLRCKDDQELLLFGEPTVDTKKKKGSKDLWPADAQIWVITKVTILFVIEILKYITIILYLLLLLFCLL